MLTGNIGIVGSSNSSLSVSSSGLARDKEDWATESGALGLNYQLPIFSGLSVDV